MKPVIEHAGATVYNGHALDVLRALPDCSVQCCVTSPPYWGLRDYGHADQIGLEKTPQEYVAHIVEIFEEVRRVLRDDGTLWANFGDSYCANGGGGERRMIELGKPSPNALSQTHQICDKKRSSNAGLKPKDLCMIPARVAIALQDAGWYLRSDIIWSKPNPMPESVTDRPTKAHEYIFLLSKKPKYFYDAEAIAENGVGREKYFGSDNYSNGSGRNDSGSYNPTPCNKRNKRSVWTVPTSPTPDAHFAVFPPKLIEPCILAGSRAGDVVLDPFLGSGTTAMVATKLGRRSIGIELNPDYLPIIKKRLNTKQTVLFDVAA